MYYKGTHDAVQRGHRIALQDSTRAAVATVDTAHARSETVMHVAAEARGVSDATRAQRVAVKQAALSELLDPGLPKLAALVALDDSLSARDSVTIAVQAGAIDTLKAEIAARARLDTLRVNTIALDVAPPKESHAVRNTLLVAVAVVAVVKGPEIARGIGKALTTLFRMTR